MLVWECELRIEVFLLLVNASMGIAFSENNVQVKLLKGPCIRYILAYIV